MCVRVCVRVCVCAPDNKDGRCRGVHFLTMYLCVCVYVLYIILSRVLSMTSYTASHFLVIHTAECRIGYLDMYKWCTLESTPTIFVCVHSFCLFGHNNRTELRYYTADLACFAFISFHLAYYHDSTFWNYVQLIIQLSNYKYVECRSQVGRLMATALWVVAKSYPHTSLDRYVVNSACVL